MFFSECKAKIDTKQLEPRKVVIGVNRFICKDCEKDENENAVFYSTLIIENPFCPNCGSDKHTEPA